MRRGVDGPAGQQRSVFGGESSTQLTGVSEPSPIGDLGEAIKGAFPSLTDEQIEDWLQAI